MDQTVFRQAKQLLKGDMVSPLRGEGDHPMFFALGYIAAFELSCYKEAIISMLESNNIGGIVSLLDCAEPGDVPSAAASSYHCIGGEGGLWTNLLENRARRQLSLSLAEDLIQQIGCASMLDNEELGRLLMLCGLIDVYTGDSELISNMMTETTSFAEKKSLLLQELITRIR